MSVFDWCRVNDHANCAREYQRFFVDPRTNKPVMLEEVKHCECKKRGCKCYVPPAERAKTKKPRKRKK